MVEPVMSGHGSHSVLLTRATAKRSISIALGITVAFMGVEIVAGIWTGSLALLADAAHMATDAAALAFSLFAFWIGDRPPTLKSTFGYRRLEILAALMNGLVLWVTVGFIAHEAYARFRNPTTILAGPMFWVALAGLAANIGSALVLRSSQRMNLNTRGAYLNVMGDMWGSIGVIVAAVMIYKTGWRWVDPVASVLVCLVVLHGSWILIKDSMTILMEAVPAHLDTSQIRKALESLDDVKGVHDLHIWTVTSGYDVLSGHLMVNQIERSPDILKQAQDLLHDRFALHHVTLQIEKSDGRVKIPDEGGCHG